jgi:BTB/POZ domain
MSFIGYICRGMLSDVVSVAELPLDEDAATVRLLISGMYDAHSPVSCSTIQPALELARKYDVEDIQLQCESFLDAEVLSTSNLLRYIKLACAFGIQSVISRCQDYVAAADNYNILVRCAQ